MNQALINRGFEFEVILQRKSRDVSFTLKELWNSVEEAKKQLAADLQISEVIIENEVHVIGKYDELEMRTVIYYKALKGKI